jgi:cytosine deaminase
MYRYDLLIKNVNVFSGGNGLDVAVKDGFIVKTEKGLLSREAAKTVEASGKLLSPGFVDSHTHIDKALIPGDPSATDLLSAITASEKYVNRLAEEKILGDILDRSRKVLNMAISQGTTAIKTNVLINKAWRLKALEAMLELREEYRDRIDLYTVVPWERDFENDIDSMASRGAVDFIGGYPSLSADYKEDLDFIFKKALRFGLPIDIHVDESDTPDIGCFEYVLDKTIETGLAGKVTCGHVTALSAAGMDEKRAKAAIERAARAGINITTLTSCNLFLMNSGRRGPTRVKEFIEAGVNVAIASDNIRDPFRPFGNADLLEEALLCAQVHKFGLPNQLEKIFSMISVNGAKNTLLGDCGIHPGAEADMVLLDAPSVQEAIISQAKKILVIKRGTAVYSEQ